MRAIVVEQFGGPEVLRLGTAPDPMPGPGDVLIRVRAAGVNPYEAYIRAGTYAFKPKLPYVPGSDGAGDVVAVGDGVTGLKAGDRVYCGSGMIGIDRPGTYAELVAAPRDRVWRLPDALNYEQGAAIGVPYATAYMALFDKAQARRGEWVLVHGASGAVGSAVVQLAAANGMRVVGTAGTDDGRRLIEEMGAERAFDHRDEAHVEAARELTGGHGFDVIVEMLANANLGRDLPALATGGRVIVVGSRGPVEINPRDLMTRQARIEGFTLFGATAEDMTRIHAGLREHFERGKAAPSVGRRFPLAEAAEAHRAMMESSALGKTVLVP